MSRSLYFLHVAAGLPEVLLEFRALLPVFVEKYFLSRNSLIVNRLGHDRHDSSNSDGQDSPLQPIRHKSSNLRSAYHLNILSD